MTGKRSLPALAALVALWLCATAAAQAASTVSPHERATFAHAMGAYERALDSTPKSEVVAQMRREERRIHPCVKRLSGFYRSGNPHTLAIDAILGMGGQETGERWYDSAAVTLEEAMPPPGAPGPGRPSAWWLGHVGIVTHADICAVIQKWSDAGYARARQPEVLRLIGSNVSPSPVAATGTRFARTFASWGFAGAALTQLVAEFNHALSRYAQLNRAAGEQFIGWLRQQGLYQDMRPADRAAIRSFYG